MTTSAAISASVHILGSVSGYCTLSCSSDLSAGDREALEILGFGQTDDPEYLGSLASLPAGFGRSLPSGRYGLTRCFAGAPDSAGRQTLLFATMVFSASDWVRHVSIAAWDVLSDVSAWSFREHASTERVNVLITNRSRLAPLRETILRGAGVLAVAQAQRAIAVCGDSADARAAVAQIASVLPSKDRTAVRWGVGVLSVGAAVDICTLPDCAETSGRRRLLSFDASPTELVGYASALSQFWKEGEEPPRTFIDGVSRLNDAKGSLPQAEGRPVVSSNTARFAAWFPLRLLLLALCGLLAVLGAGWLALRAPKPVAPIQVPASDLPAQAAPPVPPESGSPVEVSLPVAPSAPAFKPISQTLNSLRLNVMRRLRPTLSFVRCTVRLAMVEYSRRPQHSESGSVASPKPTTTEGLRAYEPEKRPVQELPAVEPKATEMSVVANPLILAHGEVVAYNKSDRVKSVREKIGMDQLRLWHQAITPPPKKTDGPIAMRYFETVKKAVVEQRDRFSQDFKKRRGDLQSTGGIPKEERTRQIQSLLSDVQAFRGIFGTELGIDGIENDLLKMLQDAGN